MTDTTVKFFDSNQSSGPMLTNTAGSLIALLDAVLVNGWGSVTATSAVVASGVCTLTFGTTHPFYVDGVALVSGITSSGYTSLNADQKITAIGTNSISFATTLADQTLAGTITAKVSPLGWSKVFSGTNLAVYQSANVAASGALLRVDDTTTTYASVRGYSAMTDISTGTDVFPTATQQAVSCWWKSDAATARPWFVYGNDRFFFIGIASSASYAGEFILYGFGDCVSRKSGDAYRAGLFSSSTVTLARPIYNYQPITMSSPTYGLAYSPRSYSALGSPVALTRIWFGSGDQAYGSGVTGKNYPNSPDNGILYTSIELLEGLSIRSELPGILATPQAITTNIADNTRFTGTASGKNVVYRQIGSASSGGIGGVFFDVTGPWSY
jgi:hypothetical protein